MIGVGAPRKTVRHGSAIVQDLLYRLPHFAYSRWMRPLMTCLASRRSIHSGTSDRGTLGGPQALIPRLTLGKGERPTIGRRREFRQTPIRVGWWRTRDLSAVAGNDSFRALPRDNFRTDMRRKAAVHLSFESALRPAKNVGPSNKVKWLDAQPG